MADAEYRVWRTRPVFLTSTFRDMHAERDHLRERVIPELQERLRQRFHHLEVIDLRWGVQTATETEAAGREQLVLKVCLGEIERSRPFLIALLGDRYGWVPPDGRMRTATDEAGFAPDMTGRSVTELEIRYGVLDSADQRERSWFYFRRPLPYNRMPPDVAARYSDAHNPDPNQRRLADHLAALKTAIREGLPGRIREYDAGWDAEHQHVTGLEAWGQQVLDDLWADLARETEAFLGEAPLTWQEAEADALDAFIEDRTRLFVGREGITRQLLDHALAPDGANVPWGTVVTGEAGLGKSSLFGHVVRGLQDDPSDPLVLAHAAGVTPRSGTVDALRRRWVFELAHAVGQDDPLTDASTAEEVERALNRLLVAAGARRRVVLVIDALNQFEGTTQARHMTWLPQPWPANVRLIATAVPGQASASLLERQGAVETPLEPLTEDEACQVAQAICGRYHRQLPQGAWETLWNRMGPKGAPAAGNALWLDLAVEELNLLDQDAFELAETRYAAIDDPEARLRRLVIDTAAAFPPDVAGLYGRLLDRAERLFGTGWARPVVALIAVSRAGWRESDFRTLVPRVAQEVWGLDPQWDPLEFAALRRIFRGHLVERGGHGRWNFAHMQLRLAALARLQEQNASAQDLHRALAAYLRDDLPREDPLHQAETMVHLIGADDQTGAAAYAGSDLTGGEKRGATQALGDFVLGALPEWAVPTSSDAVPWVAALPGAAGLAPAARGRLCERFLFDVNDLLEPRAPIPDRLPLLEAASNALTSLAAADPTNAGWQRDLGAAHCFVGIVLQEQGRLDEALRAYSAYQSIAERLAKADPTNTGWQRDLWVSCYKIADVTERLQAPGAEVWWRRAYDGLSGIQRAGLHLSPQDERVLEQLRGKVDP